MIKEVMKKRFTLLRWIIIGLAALAWLTSPAAFANEVTIELEKQAPPMKAPKISEQPLEQQQPVEPVEIPVTEESLEDPFADEFEESAEIDDRFETYNRFMFGVNETMEEYFFDPISKGYRAVVPERTRLVLKNALSNASAPVSFVSSAVQGDFEKSGDVLGRFLLNSTVGLGGLFDVAGEQLNWKAINEDFGQALGSRGMPAGPYLVLPFFGPTTARHAIGRTVDGFLTPANYFLPFVGNAGMTVGDQVNNYSFFMDDKKALDRDAIDRYESMKYFYFHNREKQTRE